MKVTLDEDLAALLRGQAAGQNRTATNLANLLLRRSLGMESATPPEGMQARRSERKPRLARR